MKKLFLIVAMIIISFSLVSCARHCGYPTECWKGYYNETPCGTYVISPCQKYCDACTFNDVNCKTCLACVNRDGCGYGAIPDYSHCPRNQNIPHHSY